MHICFPSLSYPLNGEPTSGVGSQVRLLARALTAAGHQVSVVDLSQQPYVNDDDGVAVHRVRAHSVHWLIGKLPLIGKTLVLPARELEYSFAIWKAVRAIDKTQRIDVIEGTETGMLMLARGKGTPLVIRLHGEQYTFQRFTPGTKLSLGLRITRALQRVALRRAKLLISPSRAHAREIRRELEKPLPPMVVVPNNVSMDGVTSNGTVRRNNTVLYASRIDKGKGIETFIKAAARATQSVPDARFVIAGDFHSSISQDEFRALLESSQLNGSLAVVGPLGTKALSELYKSSSIAVLPSYYETFGLAALEPMVYGTPVVVSDSGGLPEVVLPNINGTLIPAGDETALADAIVSLLKDSETRTRMGSAAALHAAKFDVRNVTAVTERLYQWAIGDGSEDAEEHVFFSPHADDVVLSCGGAIERLLNRKKRVQVVTVFAPQEDATHSAFARHIHRKWRIVERVRGQRMLEDAEALRLLGVTNHRQLNYVEGPDRSAVDGAPLYASYDELTGKIAAADEVLIEELFQKAIGSDFHANSILYFPLSIGQHVDHQILYAVGCRLAAAGKRVRFYEDYPYAENFERDASEINWLSHVIHVPLKGKLRALGAYHSQLPGLGGSMREATKRVRRFSTRLNGSPVERFWESIVAPNTSGNGTVPAATLPLNRVAESLALRNFKEFTDTFRWHDPDEILPVGAGSCADVGCGNGRHKELVEKRGYKWLGFDRGAGAEIKTDALALPLRSESQAAVVAWQVLEYVDNPFKVFAEAARVLETGGVFCGSVSFLEPVHGRTYFNLSPLAVEKLLRENGFADITIKPGLNGFALFLWTWLRRLSIPRLELLAVPLAFVLLAPLAAVLFATSWLLSRLGLGSGHFMRWISRTAPLEFAGHVMFSARKQAHK
jgi:glycosyltransferase involved in cell wall biosynthesis/LmbE family N-acetylglucosaminyl deacetylase/SAM-dependent methyltransferase